ALPQLGHLQGQLSYPCLARPLTLAVALVDPLRAAHIVPGADVLRVVLIALQGSSRQPHSTARYGRASRAAFKAVSERR
ncbi:MAG: hypothetical protein J7M15_06195, partial [Anaerolineae bacterium]|nr:hypothetical protein [Anaerolineae bacterium]